MRKVLGIAIALVSAGCNEPQCGSDELKVGSKCFEVGEGEVDAGQAGADAASEGPTAVAPNAGPTPDAGAPGRGPEPFDGGAAAGGEADAGAAKVFTCPAPGQCAEWPMAVPNGKFAPSYVNDAETTTDQHTQLVWQRRHVDQEFTWSEAKAYCDALSLGGKSDWRLPSLIEVRSLFDVERPPSMVAATVYLPEDVPAQGAYYWWTSSLKIGAIDRMYAVALAGMTAIPMVVGTPGWASYSARCVRGGSAGVGSRYTISRDQLTVLDNWTKLVWRRREESGLLSTTEAQERCAAHGYNWRVPKTKELFSLVDPVRLEPTIDAEAFPDTSSEPFWTSESEPSSRERQSRRVAVNFGPEMQLARGTLLFVEATFAARARCVR